MADDYQPPTDENGVPPPSETTPRGEPKTITIPILNVPEFDIGLEAETFWMKCRRVLIDHVVVAIVIAGLVLFAERILWPMVIESAPVAWEALRQVAGRALAAK